MRDVAHGVPRLGIPNQTVKRLMYGYLRDAYDDVGVFAVDGYSFSGLVRQMAYDGTWRPALDFLRDALAEQTGIRIRRGGEAVGGRAAGARLLGGPVLAASPSVGAAYWLGGGVSWLGVGRLPSGGSRRGGKLMAARNRRLRGEIAIQPVLDTLLRGFFVPFVAIMPVEDMEGVVHDKRDGH